MKSFIKRYKEILFLMGVVFVVGLAAHDLFNEQQQNSGLINSGNTLQPSNFGGRVSCEVPIPRVGPRKETMKQESSPEKLQELDLETKSAAANNEPIQ